ncbi:MAG: beta-mannosidase [Acidimicrobiaceae bacterium]|jgi:beta-mannosidase
MADAATRWNLCATPPGAAQNPDELTALDLQWLPATVPGTAASALRAAGRWSIDDDRDFDADDWWWRATFRVADGSEHSSLLDIGGLATIADVWLDGRHILHSENMFVAHAIDVGQLESGSHDVTIRCGALAPLLAMKRPRPRWKTRLVRNQSLRWFRTSLLGRMPGWSPTGAPVGPWRGCDLVAAHPVVSSTARAICDGADGVVTVDVRLRDPEAHSTARLVVTVGAVEAEATLEGDRLHATVRLSQPVRWWPHTHGEPKLYDVTLSIDDSVTHLGRVGFRTIEADTDDGGFSLRVNDQSVFCRGASWMPVDPVALTTDAGALRAALDDVRRANMNMLRLSGTTAYEEDTFYDLCDELGILVWQDVMFANMDPPTDPDFVTVVKGEVTQLLDRLGHRPCLAVLCGGSEVEQQAAMLGLSGGARRMPLFDDIIPTIAEAAVPGLPYVTSSPTGGVLPFHNDSGVAHYYGVGAYERPLTDARRANVRFATECLAIANVPDTLAAEQADSKQGVPHDNGADWDFADVRDHYARELFDIDPDALRAANPNRYLDVARATSGELIAATVAEWRRVGSSCAGSLIWFLRDLHPGAGWGLVDAQGLPKPAWWYARRAMAPVAVLALDEGLNGLHLHLVNDTASAIEGTLRVDLFARGELLSDTAEHPVKIAGRSGQVVIADALFDGFRDLTWAYRFGPPSYDVIAVTLLDSDDEPIARDFHLPVGRARELEPAVGLTATSEPDGAGQWRLTIRSDRFAQSVALQVAGFRPDDNWFHVAPGTPRSVKLEALETDGRAPEGEIRALNSVSGCRIRAAE